MSALAMSNDIRILFVDDEPMLTQVAERYLRKNGAGVVALCDSEQAADVIDRELGSFDILVTDYVMPVFNGGDLLARARRQRPQFPVIVSSGHLEWREACSDADGFLPKPYTPSRLLEFILEVLGRARG